jgi:hypothetical protein
MQNQPKRKKIESDISNIYTCVLFNFLNLFWGSFCDFCFRCQKRCHALCSHREIFQAMKITLKLSALSSELECNVHIAIAHILYIPVSWNVPSWRTSLLTNKIFTSAFKFENEIHGHWLISAIFFALWKKKEISCTVVDNQILYMTSHLTLQCLT